MKISINTDRDAVVKAVLAGIFPTFKIIDIYGTHHGIYNPVFPYSGSAVFEKLYAVIHLLVGRGYHFDDPVWGAIAAFII